MSYNNLKTFFDNRGGGGGYLLFGSEWGGQDNPSPLFYFLARGDPVQHSEYVGIIVCQPRKMDIIVPFQPFCWIVCFYFSSFDEKYW